MSNCFNCYSSTTCDPSMVFWHGSNLTSTATDERTLAYTEDYSHFSSISLHAAKYVYENRRVRIFLYT